MYNLGDENITMWFALYQGVNEHQVKVQKLFMQCDDRSN